MKKFVRDATMLFLALRAGDAISIAAGMWFVPKYVSPEDIGAVLPATSFATLLSLPVFALAMTVMKESSHLAANGERGKIKSLLGSVFAAVSAISIAVLAVAAVLMPKFTKSLGVGDASCAYLAIAASFLGCVAPIWTDALQSLKRFRALAIVEVCGSAMRFAVMFFAMPLKALAGYFLAQASLPAFRILFGIASLRKDLSAKSEPFWNEETAKRMAKDFLAILAYQSVPMAVSAIEHTLLRTSLPPVESAAFYMISRYSDALYFLTLPMLLVMFPYTATAAARGDSTRPYVVKCSAVTLAVAGLAAISYCFAGDKLLSLMPNGSAYTGYAYLMPVLALSTALTSCQVFFANSEVSAGRFSFLRWFVPLHAVYAGLFFSAVECGYANTLSSAVAWFAAVSVLRFAFCLLAVNAKVRRSNPCG